MNPLPLPWKTDDSLPAYALQGSNFWMDQYGKKGHRYFGGAGVTCANCDTLRRYSVYIDTRDYSKGWYVETTSRAWGMILAPRPTDLLKDPQN
jgi:hypothetical protein